jgi:hypothetical protein
MRRGCSRFLVVLSLAAALCAVPAAAHGVDYTLDSDNTTYTATYGAPGDGTSYINWQRIDEGEDAMVSLDATQGATFLIPRYRSEGEISGGRVYVDNMKSLLRTRSAAPGTTPPGWKWSTVDRMTGGYGALVLVYTSAFHTYAEQINDWAPFGSSNGGYEAGSLIGNATSATHMGYLLHAPLSGSFPKASGAVWAEHWYPAVGSTSVWDNTTTLTVPLPGKQVLGNYLVVISWVPRPGYEATHILVSRTWYCQIQGSHGAGWWVQSANNVSTLRSKLSVDPYISGTIPQVVRPFFWEFGSPGQSKDLVGKVFPYIVKAQDDFLASAYYKQDWGFGTSDDTATVEAVHEYLHGGGYQIDQSRYFIEDFEPPPLEAMDPNDDPNTWLNDLFEDVGGWFDDNLVGPVGNTLAGFTDWFWILIDFGGWFGG